ncbi:septal ring lytic transglycosylase RlpA family protein [Lyngbya confervoides]|uniref:Probable endolytic peptidoglycan transglycosylase RlpA n=1 Tax=Lyngbya confervoides BDU141951 TaxID=1574623 RepID=A0ABD4T1V4_9CYAN|nr:septal ring lytic transglycosylase RlpA family protein [Lyngbya confervoides]MCM1982653.1 septal ring lytic transglycosylase RlpA family protein [Lyngbya confervoides BDU141951]
MNKIVLPSLASALIVSVIGGLSVGHTAPESISPAEARSQAEALFSPSKDASAQPAVTKVGRIRSEDNPAAAVEAAAAIQLNPVATVFAHELEGKAAVTVYVSKIPVATFLGQGGSKASQSTNDADAPMARATQFANLVNQMSQSEFDAGQIGVKWDKDQQTYVIHAQNQPILALSDQVTLPKATGDRGEDALQMTNLLRRQLGEASPLREITGRPVPPKPAAVQAVNAAQYQSGWASWYGPGFHGNLTASGARFNQYALTAAHRTLPFGTQVRVTNLNNGRAVTVTVNDRGPFIHDRVIDLSMGAAQALGVVSSGVAPVRLDIVR